MGTRQVMAGSVGMLTFPQTQLQAFKEGDRTHYGLRLKVIAKHAPFLVSLCVFISVQLISFNAKLAFLIGNSKETRGPPVLTFSALPLHLTYLPRC